MRKLLWILLPLPLLMLLAYSALPYVARTLIEQWLSSQGFRNPRIELRHPDWDRLQITRVELTQKDSDRIVQLHLDHAEVLFRPTELLFEHQIRELRIPRATLTVTDTATAQSQSAPLATSPAPVELSRFAPQQLFSYAPSRRLVIGRLTLKYQGPGRKPIQLQGNIDLTTQLLLSRLAIEWQNRESDPAYLDITFNRQQQLTLSLSHQQQSLLHIQGTLHDTPKHWQLNLATRGDAKALHAWLEPLLPPSGLATPDVGQWAGTMDVRLPSSLPIAGNAWLSQLALSFSQHLQAKLKRIRVAHLQADALTLDAQFKGELQHGQFKLTISPQHPLEILGLRQDNIGVKQLRLRLEHPLTVKGLPGDWAHWQISPISLRVNANQIHLPGQEQLSLAPFHLLLTPRQLQPLKTDLTLTLPRVTAQLASRALPPFAAKLAGDWTQAGTGRGTLRIDVLNPALALDGNWQLTPNELTADWRLQRVPLTTLQPLLQRYRSDIPPGLTFTGGTLAMNGRLALRPSVSPLVTADTQLRSASMKWKSSIDIQSLDADTQTTLSQQGTLNSSGQLRLGTIDAGVPIGGPSVSYRFRLPPKGAAALQLSPMTLSLLGGQARIPALQLDPFKPDLSTRVSLSNIELARILALYQQPGLSGDIRIGGELPLHLSGTQITVDKGRLNNEASGWLRYQASDDLKASAAGNPGLQLALSALTNLQIKEMNLQADYAKDGTLELVTHFKGHNPDWQQGRPINLTLNLEENLPILLKSLQMADRIGEAVDKRLQH